MSGVEPPVARRDAVEKVTGSARFTGDITLPGMQHAVVVRSTRAHAKLRFVETSTAAASPGVTTVITAEDLAGIDAMFGNIVIDRPILAGDVARFEGEPIAIVVAETLRDARAAAETVHIGFEDQTPVATIADAKQADRTVHDREHRPGGISGIRVDADPAANVCHRHVRRRGEEPKDADLLVLEGTYRFPSVYQYAMEPHTAVASFQHGQLDVWSSAQHPFAVRRELARIFGMDLAAVRVAVPFIGGGFGSKSWTKVEPLAAVAAWVAGTPVRLACTVTEAMQTSRRHAAEVTVRSCFSSDGRLVHRRVRADFDTGAYTDNGPQVITSSLDSAVAPYDVPAYDLEATAWFTHLPPAGSMRAIGGPQVNWACESQLDEAARRLGIEPLELRRRNLARRGTAVFDGLTPADAEPADLLETLEEGLDAELPAHPAANLPGGRGVAVAMTGAGASPVTSAWLRLHADGSITLHCGSTEIGQGSRTVLPRVAARALGVPESAVAIVASDSLVTPYDQSTGASRTTTVTGSAVLAAANDLRDQLREIAAELGDVGVDDITFDGGKAVWTGGAATYSELVVHRFGSAAGELLGRGYSGRRVPGSLGATTPAFWELAAGGVDLRVDPDTGQVHILRYVAASDVGTALDQNGVHGQEVGAVVMGLGHALSEELQFSDGRLLNAGLAHYAVPMATNTPWEITSKHVANADGPGPFGARGVGEGGVVPVGAAVGNALREALGIEFYDLPLTRSGFGAPCELVTAATERADPAAVSPGAAAG